MHVYIKHRESNIKHFLANECIRVSLRSYLNRSRPGHDARAGRRRRNATGTVAPAHLLGARYLDRQSFPLPRGGMVDLLSLAQSTNLAVFSVRLRSNLANNLISGVALAFSAGRRRRSCR